MKQPVVFFLPNVTGGVASVVSNIVMHAGADGRLISAIAYNDVHDKRKPIIFPAHEKDIFQRFRYNSRSNFYYTVRKLRKKISLRHPVIVATDALEMEMINLTALDEKLIFIVLGDFEHYYGIAKKYQSIIDGFIAISGEILIKLLSMFPRRKEDIHLAYFPTPVVSNLKSVHTENGLRIIFAGRLEPGKNPLALLQINRILKEKGINVNWTIVGDGPLGDSFKQMAIDAPEFVFTGTLSNNDLHLLYLKQDVFIMTSEMEGLPVSLIEAMKTGLVPVVSDIPGGIKEIVLPGLNGFLCSYNDEAAFAHSIERLATDTAYYQQLSIAAIKTANKQFDPLVNSKRYFDIIDSTPFIRGRKQFSNRIVTRLDRSWMPPFLVKWIRNFQFAITRL